MVLLAGFDALFLGEVLGQHPAAVAIRAGAVHRAHRAREGLDMVEILPGIGAQRVERQAAFGPRLVEGMLSIARSATFASIAAETVRASCSASLVMMSERR